MDFLDGADARARGGRLSGRGAAGRGLRAARRGGRDARGGGARRRDVLSSCSAARRWRSSEPDDAAALWRWRDGFNGVRDGRARGEGDRGRVVPRRAPGARGSSASSEIAARHGLRSCAWGHGGDGNVHATVLVDPAEEARARRGAGGRRRSCSSSCASSAARSPPSTASGCSSAGCSRRSGTRERSSCTSRSSGRSTRRAC